MKNAQYYNDFYKMHGFGVHSDPDRFAKVASLCRGSVLDFACGTGDLSDYYSGPYTGVDFSQTAIFAAHEARRKDAVFVCAGISDYFSQFVPRFDTVYFGEFLEHIDKDGGLLLSVVKKLNPGGRIIVSVPNGARVPDESHVRVFSVPTIRRDYSKYGKVCFHNWSGFHDRILFSIEPEQTEKNDVSLVMIVKDEEKGLEGAILSAIEFVDQIIISVDSKSADKTADIAKLYADEFKIHKWKDDFSVARNYAQENVKTKWILLLDGHEYVRQFGHAARCLSLNHEGIMASIVMENGMTFHFPRLFRSSVRWKYAIHNLNDCSTTIRCDDFVIVHDRLNRQNKSSALFREKQREEMIPSIMGDMLKKNKKHIRPLFHLGNFHMMRQHWDKAIFYYRRYLKYSDFTDEKYLVLLHVGICRQMNGQFFRALRAFEKADKFNRGRWETALLIGGNFFAQRNFPEAVKGLTQSLNDNSSVYHYQPFSRDLFEIWDLIGSCYAFLGSNGKAKIAWERSLELAKSDIQKKRIATKIDLVDFDNKGRSII